MLRDKNVDQFMEELASASPAPGGGSAAAIAGSLGASLASMVFNLTIDNKASEGLDPEIIDRMKAAREKLADVKVRFIDLMDEDTANFTMFIDALQMPKTTDEEKAVRKEALDKAKIAIIDSPEKIAFLADEIWEAVELAEEYGNPNAISDAGVAALMLNAAVKAALLNVKINLPMVKDEARAEEIRTYIQEIIQRSDEKTEKIYGSVSKKLEA